MIIDPHVHFRDFKQSYKETVKHGLEVARDSGLSAVFDMPNTDPLIIDRETLEKRLRIAKEANVPEVFYGVYLGATANSEQLKRAMDLYREFSPHVVGFKLFAGESVGNLAVVNFSEQLNVYKVLAEEGYNGVLGIHAESERAMRKSVWDSSNPISHCIARPPEAEVESIKEQLILYNDSKFPGKIHIHHVSCPESVELIQRAKKNGVRISLGVCPHHLFYNQGQMNSENGILWKMNPPLRPRGYNAKMLEDLREGRIDFMETDHAPHSVEDKFEKHMSGIPGLPWWPKFIEYLKINNFSDKRIEEVTFGNAQKIFGIDIVQRKNPVLKDRTRDEQYAPFKYYEELENLVMKKNSHKYL
ncbi:dihydroorotase [Candidatus Pacearchaeota archaeon]|nr:dihydroorotase [Candidatus Pacearchaeota archaeon]